MDIDLSVLRLLEREKEIPFEELVHIIEQAILTAYVKHIQQDVTKLEASKIAEARHDIQEVPEARLLSLLAAGGGQGTLRRRYRPAA